MTENLPAIISLEAQPINDQASVIDALAEKLARKLSENMSHAPRKGADLTCGAVFDLYMRVYARPFTRRPDNSQEYWDRYCRQRWAAVPIGEVTRDQVQTWVSELGIAKGKRTANRSHTVLAAAVNWAIKKGYIDLPFNPCSCIDLFRVEARERFLQPEEIQRFCDAVDMLPSEDMRDFLWMCLLTGARRCNVQAMRWSEISIESKQWRIPVQKNGKSHTIALSDAAAIRLQQRLAERDHSVDWVFPSKKSACGHLRWPGSAWQQVLRRSGITDLTLHDLRRSVGSYLAIAGYDGFLIAKALGHKDLRSTAIYARLNLDPVRAALDKVQARWLPVRQPMSSLNEEGAAND